MEKDQSLKAAGEQRSSSGIIVGFAVGSFLFWLTIKIVQMISAV